MSRSAKRQRKKDGRRARIEAQQRIEKQQHRRNRVITVTVVVIALIVVGFGISRFGGDDSESAASDATTTTAAAAGFTYGTGECAPAEKPTEPVRTFADAPKQCIDPTTTDYGAVVRTSMGDFTIDLSEDTAPGTVNNFVTLAKNGFYDGLSVHRVVQDFVIQTGDPNGDGSGGPGYQIADENLPADAAEYPEGAVAMANSGANTNGSQWFVLTGTLPSASYSLFGQVTSGLDVVTSIQALYPESGDGAPTEAVTVTGVDITETAKASATTTTAAP